MAAGYTATVRQHARESRVTVPDVDPNPIYTALLREQGLLEEPIGAPMPEPEPACP
ncbi:hypothetical protein SAMN04487818_10155 [Actinokineospora terrae]|uniref:Uncharacterized protein n=1 Tax=Actinokineospora terrae TaxID=155974 RepID=A0A1H9K7Q7_9PSEU|nr:hypothetical protein SAMN04487818_10155 [Actinokineospora terrae]